MIFIATYVRADDGVGLGYGRFFGLFSFGRHGGVGP
jgi:hypothetical protein